MSKTVGVLGGMGPEATVDFMSRIMAATNARRDQDHIRMLVDHNPLVPNRHDSIAGVIPDIGPTLAAMAAGLQRAGADVLVMVCNTAHAFAADIEASVSIPFLNMVEVTVASAVQTDPGVVGVMAAEGCLSSGLYQDALARHGCGCVLWSDAELEAFMQLLYRIKAGERSAAVRDEMQRLALLLSDRGAERLIAGCTEVPLVLEASLLPVELVSSTDALVKKTIQFVKGGD